MDEEGKIARTPRRPVLAAADLEWLIGQWFEWLNEHHQSGEFDAETVRAYEAKLSYFVAWWKKVGPAHNWRLDARLLEQYEYYLRSYVSERTAKTLSFTTRQMALRRLRQFLIWAYEEGYTPDRNYSFLVPVARDHKLRRKAASLEDLHRLEDIALRSNDPIRDITLVVFFVGTGCRREEAARVQIEDIQFTSGLAGVITIRGKRTKAKPLWPAGGIV